MKQSFADQIKAARSANTPILAIETADNNAAIQRIAAALSDKTPLIQWDVVRGWTPVETVIDGAWVENQAGVVAMSKCANGKDLMNPVASLEEALNLPGKLAKPFQPGAILFIHNAHEYLKDPDFAQALFNLRDPFKSNMRTIILLGPAFTLPAQLAQHVTVLDDPLPTTDELATVLRSFGETGLKLTEDEERRAVEALLGLGTFAAEQSVATSLHVNGSVTLEFERLWARKRKMITDTPGLEFRRGIKTFADMRGYQEAVRFGQEINSGRNRPNLIVLIDEGEQQAGGSKTDSSGVSQKMIGKLLSEMQDRKYRGQINFGIPGCGKTLYSEAMAGDCGVPLIILNLAEIESSLVGSSQERLCTALKVIYTVSNGNPYFIMTSNDLNGIPSQLKARFAYGGIWMFDLPTKDEVVSLFEFYLKRRGLDSMLPEVAQLDLAGWVPRDVEWCVEKAWDLNLTLGQAAQRVVAYGKANAHDVLSIQRQAHARYLSAAKPGAYQFDEATMPERVATPVSAGRMIEKEV